jgi:hypothetical protein
LLEFLGLKKEREVRREKKGSGDRKKTTKESQKTLKRNWILIFGDTEKDKRASC